jgi:hypothetical protein
MVAVAVSVAVTVAVTTLLAVTVTVGEGFGAADEVALYVTIAVINPVTMAPATTAGACCQKCLLRSRHHSAKLCLSGGAAI